MLVAVVRIALAALIALPALLVGAPPNFLVIVADDLGYADLGCYGGEIETANLDALAAGGLRFTQFYNTSRCWPTRASLLTGYYAQQVRRDSMPGLDMNEFGNRGVRPGWARLVSDRLRDAGYFSYHSGKWHVDGEPLENGFLHSYQSHTRAGFFHLVGQDKDGQPLPDLEPDHGAHLTTETSRHAIEFLREHAEERADTPFFLYLAFHAPHFPLHAAPEDIDRYRDHYMVGWDQLRRARHRRQRQLGITDSPLSLLDEDVGPPYDFPDAIELLGPGEVNRPIPWRRLSGQQRAFQATKMAIHAAMIDRMDREIGRVLQQVRDMGAFEDTVIFFLSDNGASAEIMVRGDGHDPDAPPGSAGTYLCLGPGFSSAANTPFRLHKTWVHEGGISTPLIVHWPAGIRARGEIRSRVGHVIDIPPTLLELAGLGIPGDTSLPEMAGRSLIPAFDRNVPTPHEALWFYHQGNRALRKGDWKIVHTVRSRADGWGSVAAEEDARPGEWQLFDLATDRSEGEDLARRHPGVVRELASIWRSWRVRFAADATRPD